MNPKPDERRADVLKAPVQPTRIAIPETLRPGEGFGCRICPAVGGSQPNVSKHLILVEKTGLQDSRQEGTMTFCWVKATRAFGILDLVDGLLRRSFGGASPGSPARRGRSPPGVDPAEGVG